MVHLALVEGVFGSVVHVYQFLPERVGIVPLARFEAHPLRRRRLLHLGVFGVGCPTREADEGAVFASAVARIDSFAVGGEVAEVLLGEIPDAGFGDGHPHHLPVSQFAIVSYKLEVVVAHLAPVPRLGPPGVSRPAGQLLIGPSQQVPLGQYELVLNVPEASHPEVHVLKIRIGGIGRRRRRDAQGREGGRGGRSEEGPTSSRAGLAKGGGGRRRRWRIRPMGSVGPRSSGGQERGEGERD
mmetsp:Transcript_60497/g.179285  ORF Transcript_60497/g.179285 Transcript_60497/m.179285 type:complete len:241 (-) Transcript_60497:135-857(-)